MRKIEIISFFFGSYFYSNYSQSLAILFILMIVSDQIHLNQSDYIQFLFINRFVLKKKYYFYRKIRNAGNYIYDYAHSFFGKYF